MIRRDIEGHCFTHDLVLLHCIIWNVNTNPKFASLNTAIMCHTTHVQCVQQLANVMKRSKTPRNVLKRFISYHKCPDLLCCRIYTLRFKVFLSILLSTECDIKLSATWGVGKESWSVGGGRWLLPSATVTLLIILPVITEMRITQGTKTTRITTSLCCHSFHLNQKGMLSVVKNSFGRDRCAKRRQQI